jgi:hypothetical protein
LAQEARSKHRLTSAFKTLGQGGVLYLVGIYAHRAAGGRNRAGNEALSNLEGLINEMQQRQYSLLGPELGQVRPDPCLPENTRRSMAELFDNFQRLQAAYGGNGGAPSEVDLNIMRSNHRRLIEELRPSVGVEFPAPLMVVLQSEAPGAPEAAFRAGPRFLIPRPPSMQPRPGPGLPRRAGPGALPPARRRARPGGFP